MSAQRSTTRYGGTPLDATALYSPCGERKYLTADERGRLLSVLNRLPRDRALFIEVLVWSGARISEILALTRVSFSITEGKVVLRTLKRRRFCMREVALPPTLLATLDSYFRLSDAVNGTRDRLWPWHRVTGWRIAKRAFALAGVTGLAATPRGCRHGFGAAATQNSVPLNLLQRWLGHARIETTCIYAGIMGDEERAISARVWRSAHQETSIVPVDQTLPSKE